MKLSMEEYIVLDFVYNHNQNKKEDITFRDYYRETGLLPEDVNGFMRHMKERGLLVWNEKEKRVDVNDEWKGNFTTQDLANELWKMHPKGNKATVKERLPKVLKKIPFDELKAKLKAYLDDCALAYSSPKYYKSLDTWLNPAKEHWMNPLISQMKKESVALKNNTQIKFVK